jgi:hypothetical protein
MFGFGEKVAGYEICVFNEREVRAAAGIVFLFAFIAFMHGFLTGNIDAFFFVKSHECPGQCFAPP